MWLAKKPLLETFSAIRRNTLMGGQFVVSVSGTVRKIRHGDRFALTRALTPVAVRLMRLESEYSHPIDNGGVTRGSDLLNINVRIYDAEARRKKLAAGIFGYLSLRRFPAILEDS